MKYSVPLLTIPTRTIKNTIPGISLQHQTLDQNQNYCTFNSLFIQLSHKYLAIRARFHNVEFVSPKWNIDCFSYVKAFLTTKSISINGSGCRSRSESRSVERVDRRELAPQFPTARDYKAATSVTSEIKIWIPEPAGGGGRFNARTRRRPRFRYGAACFLSARRRVARAILINQILHRVFARVLVTATAGNKHIKVG